MGNCSFVCPRPFLLPIYFAVTGLDDLVGNDGGATSGDRGISDSGVSQSCTLTLYLVQRLWNCRSQTIISQSSSQPFRRRAVERGRLTPDNSYTKSTGQGIL